MKQMSQIKAGFTIIELLVVISIMGILSGLMIVNFAGLRGARNLKIAQNQLVTGLRKIQSYTLSSRNISSNVPAQFYLIKFDRNNPRQYIIQAIYNVTTAPKLIDIETVKLPDGIKLAVTDPIEIDRQPLGPSINDQKPSTCALVAFRAPFAKVIMNDGCSYANFINDDYTKIKDFVANNDSITASSDSVMTIKLYEEQKGTVRTVTVNGISGLIGFQQ
jgi:prepilin-type N-terminal cleavage/methylation domain-containing protein